MPKFANELAWALLTVFVLMSLLGLFGWRDYTWSILILFDALFPSGNIINEFGEVPPTFGPGRLIERYFHLSVILVGALVFYAAWRSRGRAAQSPKMPDAVLQLTRGQELAYQASRVAYLFQRLVFWTLQAIAAGVLGNYVSMLLWGQ